MTDRKKVIKGLEKCKRCECDGCTEKGASQAPWDCPVYDNFVDSAIAMLKEQKHSETFIVIDNKTGKEADTYDIALHEDWAKHLCYCDIEGWAIEDNGTLLLVDECGQFAYADRERFKVKWIG
jgi:hypothetical protein